MGYRTLLVFITFFFGCIEEETTKKDLLKRDLFIQSLVELHTLEATINETSFSQQSLTTEFNSREKLIFDSLGTDSLLFYTTLEYYIKEKPEYLGALYDTVIASLRIRKEKYKEVVKK